MRTRRVRNYWSLTRGFVEADDDVGAIVDCEADPGIAREDSESQNRDYDYDKHTIQGLSPFFEII